MREKEMVCIKMMRLQRASHIADNGVNSSADGHLSNNCLFSAFSQFLLLFFKYIFFAFIRYPLAIFTLRFHKNKAWHGMTMRIQLYLVVISN